MAWILRGLRDGIVTTRYPSRPDGYGEGFRGEITVASTDTGLEDRSAAGPEAGRSPAGLCPTGAIGSAGGPARGNGVQVDRGLCILCGRCVDARPDLFAYSPHVESAALRRSDLIVPAMAEDDGSLARLRADLRSRVGALRRSVYVRHVDAGSDGAEEWEVSALSNPIYDVQRLGVYFTATPRHADVLLVTGVGTAGMAGPLRRTFDAMPDPKIVIAAGADAASGGLVHPTYSSGQGVGSIVPVDVWVPWSPPSPFSLLHGILLGIGRLSESGTGS